MPKQPIPPMARLVVPPAPTPAPEAPPEALPETLGAAWQAVIARGPHPIADRQPTVSPDPGAERGAPVPADGEAR